MIGCDWDLRLHRGSFLLGLAAGAAAEAAVVAVVYRSTPVRAFCLVKALRQVL